MNAFQRHGIILRMFFADLPRAIKILKQEYKRFKTPYVTFVAAGLGRAGKDPFKVLVSCIISLRTKDETTRLSSERLFKLGTTPDVLSMLNKKTVEKAIFPAGFYRTKAVTLIRLSREIIQRYNGRVPDSIDELLTLRGVGRKTANLVVTMGFGKPGICVDTHVHRIMNRWGFIQTKTPEATEFALRRRLPRHYWIIINDLLVTYGQNICKPVSPFCSICRIAKYCKKAGVCKSR